jgi:3-methyladenine DNA glycosylase AlkD
MAENTAGHSVDSVVETLEGLASKKIREEMSSRYGIVVDKAWGVRMGEMIKLAKHLGRDHALAQQLWASGWYEARSVAAMIDDPAQVTPIQMDRWCKDFDNWAIVDTVCFKLFDRSPHAFKKAKQWAARKPEFERRAGYVLMACLAAHAKDAPASAFEDFLPLIEMGAIDDRNFVKKAVSWALRAVGMRARKPARELAQKLAASGSATSRWIGKNALKALK